MASASVLYVGDDESLNTAIREIIDRTDRCRGEKVRDVRAAEERLRSGGVAFLLLHLTDLRSVTEILDFVEKVSRLEERIPVVVISEFDDWGLTCRLMKAGAVECLRRPISVSRVAFWVEMFTVRARYGQPARTADPLVRGELGQRGLRMFCFDSPAMERLVDLIRKVAPLDSTILITGETGVGKTHLARVIHELSPRRDKPFLDINCAALSSTLLESEVFGHARGAFTGADREHRGKLAQAADGTLLMDEVDSMPLDAQAKLLRAVDQRAFEAVGSEKSLTLRARLIVASNRCLEDEVAAGKFRADLYYRLNVINLHVPPLRERRDEIAYLANRIVVEIAESNGLQTDRISPDALAAIEAYSWPGNVRQLRNVLERATVLCDHSTIELSDLPETIQPDLPAGKPSQPPAKREKNVNKLADARRDAERSRLISALLRNDNNRTSTALDLGISRTALYKKLSRYDLVR